MSKRWRSRKKPDHPVVVAVQACVDAARANDVREARAGSCPTCGFNPYGDDVFDGDTPPTVP